MPPHKDSGTPKRKNRACPFKSCVSRPRSGKPWERHLVVEHGIENPTEWFRVEFERYTMGLPSIYNREDT